MTVHYVLNLTPYHPLACRSHSVSYSKVPTCCAIAKDLRASGTGQPNTKNQNKNHRTTRTRRTSEAQEPENHENQRNQKNQRTRELENQKNYRKKKRNQENILCDKIEKAKCDVSCGYYTADQPN